MNSTNTDNTKAVDVRLLAERALAKLALVPPGLAYGSRKGVVAGVPIGAGQVIAFRRVPGGVRLEVWHVSTATWHWRPAHHDLPADLQERTGEMLDALEGPSLSRKGFGLPLLDLARIFTSQRL